MIKVIRVINPVRVIEASRPRPEYGIIGGALQSTRKSFKTVKALRGGEEVSVFPPVAEYNGLAAIRNRKPLE